MIHSELLLLLLLLAQMVLTHRVSFRMKVSGFDAVASAQIQPEHIMINGLYVHAEYAGYMNHKQEG